MAAALSVLNAALILCSTVTGIIAASLLLQASRLNTGAVAPFQYSDTTLRDFELLAAAEGLLLFGSFIIVAAGLYESTALHIASRVPGLMFALLLVVLLARWRRRYP